jgi:hypothetical protein
MAPNRHCSRGGNSYANVEFEKMQREQTSGLCQPSQLETGRLSASQPGDH